MKRASRTRVEEPIGLASLEDKSHGLHPYLSPISFSRASTTDLGPYRGRIAHDPFGQSSLEAGLSHYE